MDAKINNYNNNLEKINNIIHLIFYEINNDILIFIRKKSNDIKNLLFAL